MRQRTVSDFFWRDPALASLTQEDKATLLYLLTGPSSNITGVYQIVPRIAAAEMGWTAEQLVLVLERLDRAQLVRWRQDGGWVWVRIWWSHNKLPMALSPKHKANTINQLRGVPADWLADYLGEVEGYGYRIDTLSIGYLPVDNSLSRSSRCTDIYRGSSSDRAFAIAAELRGCTS